MSIKPFIIAAGIIALILVYGYMGRLDMQDQEQAAQHTAWIKAKAREDAHRKAVRMYERGLIEQANALVYPCCQVPISKDPALKDGDSRRH